MRSRLNGTPAPLPIEAERDALPTQAAYDAVAAERDARPTAEQLAAVEAERDALPTQAAYDAVAAERDARPTAEQLASVEAERDARPTAEQLAAVEAERDARPTADQLTTVESERNAVVADIQLAYDEATAAAGVPQGDLAPVGSDGTTFDLVWTNTEDASDMIAMTMEFAEGSITNSPDLGFPGTSVPGSVLTINYQGSVTTHNEPSIAFQSPGELDFSEELIGQAGFGTSPGAQGSGDFNVFGIEVPEGTFNGENFFTVRAPNRSLYTLTSMKIASRFSFLELEPLSEIYFELAEANEAALAERDAAIAERDARPTLAEVQDARVGSIVLAKDGQTDEVSLCFGLQQTDDFVSWTAFEGGTWSDAPNGEFKLALPLGEAKKWLRLTLPE